VTVGEAEGVLFSVLDAEEIYRTRHGRYAHLRDLGPAGAKLIRQLAEGRTHLYKLTIENYSNDSFVLIVGPQHQDNVVACFVGCPRCLNFYTDETRIVRYNSHCHAATSTSAIWPAMAGISKQRQR